MRKNEYVIEAYGTRYKREPKISYQEKLLLDFQAWQLEKGYLDKGKVKNGMVQEFLNENK